MKPKVIVSLAVINVCNFMNAQQKTTFYGHRGCRGILPENTIAAFRQAIKEGADGIEWDVVVNKDNQLVISHEPYMDASYCLDSNGNNFSKSIEMNYNIYEMTYEQIKKYDCGSKGNAKFKDQQKIKSHKPLVQEAFAALNLSKTTILFEIKSEHQDYGLFQPFPSEYAQIIAQEVANFEHKKNIVFMCFDPLLLNELHKLLPEYRYVYLTYLPFKSIEKFLKEISFEPYALGMYYRTIRKKDVKIAKESGVKIFAWTVNKESDSKRLIRYGVEGIITDYPNLINSKTSN